MIPSPHLLASQRRPGVGHFQPGSTLQVALQPSPLLALPSSQPSFSPMRPSPHVGGGGAASALVQAAPSQPPKSGGPPPSPPPPSVTVSGNVASPSEPPQWNASSESAKHALELRATRPKRVPMRRKLISAIVSP